MNRIDLDVPKFRAEFPAYADDIKYPDAYIEIKWDIATCYISDLNCGQLKENCRRYAIYLMIAHLIYIDDRIANNIKTDPISSVSEGKVSASFALPPSSGPWSYWMNQTPYGQQLASLLSAAAAGGYYVGATQATAGFRNSRGNFERY